MHLANILNSLLIFRMTDSDDSWSSKRHKPTRLHPTPVTKDIIDLDGKYSLLKLQVLGIKKPKSKNMYILKGKAVEECEQILE